VPDLPIRDKGVETLVKSLGDHGPIRKPHIRGKKEMIAAPN